MNIEEISNFDCYALYKELQSKGLICLLRHEVRCMFSDMKIRHLLSCNKEVTSSGDELNCIVPEIGSGLEFEPIPIHGNVYDLREKRWLHYERAKEEALKIINTLPKLQS